MIEKVAAIIEAEEGEIWWARDHDRRYDYTVLARAAIAAMREPTEAMLAAGYEEHMECVSSATTAASTVHCVWQAMIDKALEP